jgi:hypothetical protein
MDEVEEILARLREGNGLSNEEIARLGPAQLPELRELARSPEREVRRSTLTALTVMKAPGCDDVYFQAVRETEDDLPYIALGGLEDGLEPRHQPELLAIYDTHPEGRIRGAIAQTIGTLEGRGDFWGLRKRADAEQDDDAREGLRMALARMGDGPSREEIARRLPALRENRLRLFLQHDLEYLKAPWIQKPLLPLLDDQSIHLDMRSVWHGQAGAEIPPQFCQRERVCDRVAVWVADISGRRFSFPTERMVEFTPAQLEEVRAYLRGLP